MLGREIHDNILIAQEMFNTFHKSQNKKGWFALKLDMKKAYDRMRFSNQIPTVGVSSQMDKLDLFLCYNCLILGHS